MRKSRKNQSSHLDSPPLVMVEEAAHLVGASRQCPLLPSVEIDLRSSSRATNQYFFPNPRRPDVSIFCHRLSIDFPTVVTLYQL